LVAHEATPSQLSIFHAAASKLHSGKFTYLLCSR